jgi:hypothetical protein
MIASLLGISLTLLSMPARPQQCTGGVKYPVQVHVTCTADFMTHDQLTRHLEASGTAGQLGVSSSTAYLRAGDFLLTGGVTCSGKSSDDMRFGFDMTLTRKGKDMNVAFARNLALPLHKNQGPITLTAYSYLDNDVVSGVKYSRVDYSCELRVTDLPQSPVR